MASLEKRISEWRDAGIIDAATAEKLHAYEEKRPGGNWGFYGTVGLGLVVLITGLVSIVAANWALLTANLKLIAFFSLHLTCILAFIRYSGKPGIVREALLTVAMLLTLAGIGLIAQIFNIESDGWSGIAFWLALTVSLTYLAQSRLINHLWLLGFISAVSLWVLAHGKIVSDMPVTTLFCLAAIGLAWVAVGAARGHLPVPGRLADTGKFWALVLLLVQLTPFTNFLYYQPSEFKSEEDFLPGMMILFAALVLALVAIKFSKPALSAAQKHAYYVLLSLLVVALLIPFTVLTGPAKIMGSAAFIVTWGAAAALAAVSGRKRLFDVATLIIAIRFIVIYFEVFGSLMATGIGLIMAGIVILAVCYVWHKYRRVLSEFFMGEVRR